jgi:predicted RNA-binding protein (TIGR00451 family)
MKYRDSLNSDKIMDWDGEDDLDIRVDISNGGYFDLSRISHMIRYQFRNNEGIDPVQVLFGGDIIEEPERVHLVISKNTGKIRNVHRTTDGEKRHLLSIRAEDGAFTLKLDGARYLLSAFEPPLFRVIVDNETGEYNAKGYNVFCKFILKADHNIRPGDDVMVVDEKDDLLAVGRSQGCGEFLERSVSGIGVKVKAGTISSKNKDNN